jgi:hypothetical protein
VKKLILVVALLIAAPAFAEEAPATQPAEKPKARQNDKPATKGTLIAKAPKDLWMLLPDDVRPKGKNTDEAAAKVEAWIKENGKKVEGKVQFVCTVTTANKESKGAFNAVWKDASGDVVATAPVTDPAEIKRANDTKFDGRADKLLPEVLGQVEDMKLVRGKDAMYISVVLKPSKVVSVKVVPNN